MTPPEAYDPRAYWSRLHAEGSLRSVGQSALPVELNVWLYRVLERNLRTFLRRHGLADPAPQRVFEVGAGTGYWTAFWHRLGAAQVDGCDLAASAVERLRARFPDGTFVGGDIADAGVIPADASYDLVTVINVLLHILDEDRFTAAARNVAGAVAPGGHVLLVEPALLLDASVRPLRDGASSTARLLERYREAFEAGGLVFVAAEASTVVANNPIEHGLPHIGRFTRSWTTAVREARKGPRRADLVGRILSLVDRPLMRTGAAPSGKILLFRRPL
ncbi:MAG: class I SAM-dependent methyltransferase [Candidatus Limnocylindrales bacterium]